MLHLKYLNNSEGGEERDEISSVNNFFSKKKMTEKHLTTSSIS